MGEQKTILIIADEAKSGYSFQSFLDKQADINIFILNGREALHGAIPDNTDLILLDVDTGVFLLHFICKHVSDTYLGTAKK